MPKISVFLPVFALLGAAGGYIFAPQISSSKPLIVPLLAIIMLFMGLTLKPNDFVREFRRPRSLVIGVCLQFLVMPLLAFVISLQLGVSTAIMTGMVLLGTAPGGTASNVLTYLAKGNVALSISMTLTSTLLSVLLMPWLTGIYLHKVIEVDRLGMLTSITKIVLVPVLAGVTLNTLCHCLLKYLYSALPVLSALAIVITIGIVVAVNAESLQSLLTVVAVAVLLHNSLGLACGYGCARLFGLSERQSRTIAIEVGTQNSGLAVAIAFKHFSLMAALPGALFSVTQNILGASLAGYWRKSKKS
ncbi:bile acid:sodium symporter family protein [Sansalvadorimonas verongulae]|uniref:bile acid:sodium symporter family protein n=1 Tax=Sansalvadorimonas verongulae TaxID=2172824 RepID=UPI0012BCEF53|nr:bile acid:sodium symporter family protein [Sansalvadorimonas verongulae]MTI14493.1 bile acid:sodium symporter family protein [Sansalvadorimonas verongulae]